MVPPLGYAFVCGVDCNVCVGTATAALVELDGVDEDELVTVIFDSSKDESSGAYCCLVVGRCNFQLF